MYFFKEKVISLSWLCQSSHINTVICKLLTGVLQHVLWELPLKATWKSQLAKNVVACILVCWLAGIYSTDLATLVHNMFPENPQLFTNGGPFLNYRKSPAQLCSLGSSFFKKNLCGNWCCRFRSVFTFLLLCSEDSMLGTTLSMVRCGYKFST